VRIYEQGRTKVSEKRNYEEGENEVVVKLSDTGNQKKEANK
jgi:hypothetical protein